MTDDMEVYPLSFSLGRWWLPYGPEANAETLAVLFRSDCTVVFHWSEGGSWQFHVDEEGQEVVRVNQGAWQLLANTTLTDWQQEALALVLDAIDQM
jgi:hypothetical protein